MNSRVVNLTLGILLIIFVASTFIFYQKYNAKNNEFIDLSAKWNQYQDYGDIKIKFPIDSLTKAIVVSGSTNEIAALEKSGRYLIYADFVDRSSVIPADDNSYYVRYVTGNDIAESFEKTSGNKFPFEVNLNTGKIKTLNELTAERESSRPR